MTDAYLKIVKSGKPDGSRHEKVHKPLNMTCVTSRPESCRTTVEEEGNAMNKHPAHNEPPALPSPDALKPWGSIGLPKVGEWSPDVLGEPFQARTLPLEGDEEGRVVATLVRLKRDRKYRPWETKPKFAMLYVHGRNDYFFQTKAAQRFRDRKSVV